MPLPSSSRSAGADGRTHQNAAAPVTLTEAEAEFVAEMALEHGWPGSEWHTFDPDFRQKDIARLIRRGWFERQTYDQGYRKYRWTEAGRKALALTSGEAR